jgi:SAM-dependent methyltransferase
MDMQRVERAAFAWELSRGACTVDPANGESCRWHHGLWPWLRTLDLNTSPSRFARFYRESLRATLHGRLAPRVLISGAADDEMLARVVEACAAPAKAEIAMVDLCETPLTLARRFARSRGFALATSRGDVLSYAASEPVDVICTDSFLGQFSPLARERLVSHWARLLRSGGSLITVNRLRPGANPEQRIGFSAAQARAFREVVISSAAKLPASVRPDAVELAREVERYASLQGAWPVRSADELAGMLARAGFELASLEVSPADDAAAHESAPTLAGGEPYARVHARRV